MWGSRGEAPAVWDLGPKGEVMAMHRFKGLSPLKPVERGWVSLFDAKMHQIQIYDLSEANLERPLMSLPLGARSASPLFTASPEGHWVAVSCSSSNLDHRVVQLWRVEAGRLVEGPFALVCKGISGQGPLNLGFSPQGRWLVALTWDTANLWEMPAKGRPSDPLILAPQAPEHGRMSVDSIRWAFSPDERWMCAVFNGHNLLYKTGASFTLDRTISSHFPVFSPDSRWLGTITGNTVSLFRLDKALAEKPALELRGHTDHIEDFTFCSDGDGVATASWDGTIRLWSLRQEDAPGRGQRTVLYGHESRPYHLRYSPMGGWLLSDSWTRVPRLWKIAAVDPATPSSPVTFRGPGWPVTTIAFSPDGRWLITHSKHDIARLWPLANAPLQSRPFLLTLRSGNPHPSFQGNKTAIAFTPDGRGLISACSDGEIYKWDLGRDDPSTGAVRLSGPITGRRRDSSETGIALFSRSGRRLFLMSSSEIGEHSRKSRATLVTFDGRYQVADKSDFEVDIVPRCYAFSRDDRWLALGQYDGKVTLRDLALGGQTFELWADLKTPAIRAVTDLTFSPDGRWLVSKEESGVVRSWDLTQLDEGLPPHDVCRVKGGTGDISLAFNNASDLLAVADRTGMISFYRLTSEVVVQAMPPLAFTIPGTLVFSEDGSRFASSWLGRVAVWDLTVDHPEDSRIILQEQLPEDEARLQSVTALAFSPDNHWLVTGYNDGVVKVWNRRFGELVDLAKQQATRNFSVREWKDYFYLKPYQKTFDHLPAGKDIDK
jgi:WD40 repeat protein